MRPGLRLRLRLRLRPSTSGVPRRTAALVIAGLLACAPAALAQSSAEDKIEARIDALIAEMTVEEKVGQMTLRGQSSRTQADPAVLEESVRSGRYGLMLNIMDRDLVDRLQTVATEESRLGIPVLFARDVIHGFRTVFPIPLAQAASFDRHLAEKAAHYSAREESTFGIRWTLAPMVDITRDPRWGRIAESPGEDPYLAEEMAVAMVRGFQGDDLTASDSLAACVKHFAAYGAAVGGRDYNSAPVPGALLHNVYLRPFDAATRAGAQTFMTGFHEIDGVPATADPHLLLEILRTRWGFDGFVVSDWESVTEMIKHGFSRDASDAAAQAALAGVDVEMTSPSYEEHLADHVRSGRVPESVLDDAVRHVLRVKMRLGLFENAARDSTRDNSLLAPEHLELSRTFAAASSVLLKNSGALPLQADARIAVVGPLADAPHEQLGTWTFDGKAENSVTPATALKEKLGDRATVAVGLDHSRSRARSGFGAALDAARGADVVVFFGGEEAILSGEAHSRSDLRLPGLQEELILELSKIKPVVLVLMAGRPNTLEAIADAVDSILVAWHPGTMAGPALADMLVGDVSPSGRLPVSWPRRVGQIPIYYNHKNTGRPAPDEVLAFDDIPIRAWQSSLSNTSRYLDLLNTPAYPFGFGLTYSSFEYADLKLSAGRVALDGAVDISATVTNAGERRAAEVVQLYTRDPVASLTRPIRELKGFQKISLDAGESRRVTFTLDAADLAFFDARGAERLEAGEIHVWIAPHALDGLEGRFELVDGAADDAAEAAGAGAPAP
ncbi:MAG: glycoside hydrolase family 3 N-terminal domain-containing protein [Acidobacteriota bacterium]